MTQYEDKARTIQITAKLRASFLDASIFSPETPQIDWMISVFREYMKDGDLPARLPVSKWMFMALVNEKIQGFLLQYPDSIQLWGVIIYPEIWK